MEQDTKSKIFKKLGYGVLIYAGVMFLFLVFVFVLQKQIPQTSSEISEFEGDLTEAEFSGELVPAWAPTLGPQDAKVTIVEFSDFQCPFCRQAFQPIREIVGQYPNVRLVYRHFPIVSIHPLANELAHASMCAHEQGKFWVFHDQLFLQQGSVDLEQLDQIAQSVGLDTRAFRQCQDSGRFNDEIAQDFSDAVGLGGRGTPTWIVNGKKYEGPISEEVWKQIIEKNL